MPETANTRLKRSESDQTLFKTPDYQWQDRHPSRRPAAASPAPVDSSGQLLELRAMPLFFHLPGVDLAGARGGKRLGRSQSVWPAAYLWRVHAEDGAAEGVLSP